MSKTTTFGASFIIKKDKAKNNEAPIFLRLIVDGKRADLSIKRRIPIDKWGGSKKVLGNSPEVKEFNRHLDKLYAKAYQIYEQLFDAGEPITAEIIKNPWPHHPRHHQSQCRRT